MLPKELNQVRQTQLDKDQQKNLENSPEGAVEELELKKILKQKTMIRSKNISTPIRRFRKL